MENHNILSFSQKIEMFLLAARGIEYLPPNWEMFTVTAFCNA
jgi:hypothetical protein